MEKEGEIEREAKHANLIEKKNRRCSKHNNISYLQHHKLPIYGDGVTGGFPGFREYLNTPCGVDAKNGYANQQYAEFPSPPHAFIMNDAKLRYLIAFTALEGIYYSKAIIIMQK